MSLASNSDIREVTRLTQAALSREQCQTNSLHQLLVYSQWWLAYQLQVTGNVGLKTATPIPLPKGLESDVHRGCPQKKQTKQTVQIQTHLQCLIFRVDLIIYIPGIFLCCHNVSWRHQKTRGWFKCSIKLSYGCRLVFSNNKQIIGFIKPINIWCYILCCCKDK